MISLILYGRNDSYGYNLHKRAALSLNCMAEVLTAPGDEILFVDYNTPDDFPTFPEAIADTLTPRAREMLRTFRVRPKVHEDRFAARTHLKALEPVSRNVAARRSNPANRWILSTNTDMIFVPRTGPSLSEAVADLPAGFYCAPRFELPETLWEGFDRLDPRGVIADVRALGARLHLNEIVLGSDLIRYDAPGDFQLISREDLFAINGFDEEMLLGWHVDSNISKRLRLMHGEVGDAAPFVYGYHCDHTRQVTPAHAHRSAQNDSARFVDGLTEPGLPYQADWGLASVEIEETRLGASVAGSYRAALEAAIKAPLDAPIISPYRAESYDKVPAPLEHVLPFLLDIFASYPRSTRLLWLGAKGPLLEMFADAWTGMGFGEPVTVRTSATVRPSDLARADAFVVNFGVPRALEGDAVIELAASFQAVVAAESERSAAEMAPRRIVCVNAIHNRFEGVAVSKLTAARTPFSTRLRQGFLHPAAIVPVRDWLALMRPERVADRIGKEIVGTGRRGRLAYGPYETLQPGAYSARLTLRHTPARGLLRRASRQLQGIPREPTIVLALVFAEAERSRHEIRLGPGETKVELPFFVNEADSIAAIQIRIDVPAARIDLCRVEIATDTTSDRDGRPRPVRITRQDGSIETL